MTHPPSTRIALVLLALAAVASLGSCGGGGESGADGFVFATAAPDRYARIDRMGQPALGTALLSPTTGSPIPVDGTGAPVNPGASNPFNNFDSQRDALNRGDPVNDARDFAFMLTRGPQANSLANFHFKLGPQMRALGFTPCSTETVVPPAGPADVDISACVAQAGPVVIPDVVTYNPNATPGWPNGRRFDDPVIDRLLAHARRAGRHHQLAGRRQRRAVTGGLSVPASGPSRPLNHPLPRATRTPGPIDAPRCDRARARCEPAGAAVPAGRVRQAAGRRRAAGGAGARGRHRDRGDRPAGVSCRETARLRA